MCPGASRPAGVSSPTRKTMKRHDRALSSSVTAAPFKGFRRSHLLPRIGDISQMGGLRHYQLLEGRARGIEAIDFRTGGGLAFTVLPGRGLDIAWADYKSTPLTHITKAGIVGPQYYEKDGLAWLRTFFGGLLTTCGLANVGWPCHDETDPFGIDRARGLHGRISTTPAEEVCLSQDWAGEQLVLRVRGKLRQACFKAEHLTLTREITATLGAASFRLHDEVENRSQVRLPLMILYHINFGYPFLDAGSELLSRSSQVEPEGEDAEANLSRYATYEGPRPDYPEEIFHHTLDAAADGVCTVALLNPAFRLCACLRFQKRQLPCFAQWKFLQRGDYVTGLEPANCRAEGCEQARRNGRLQMIGPGEIRTFDLEFGMLEGAEPMAEFRRSLAGTRMAMNPGQAGSPARLPRFSQTNAEGRKNVAPSPSP